MRKILSIGLVRGLVGQVIGMAAGYGVFTAIRAALGLRFWAEPAWVFGAVVSALAFIIALGGFSDWWKWAKGEETPEPEEIEETPGWRRYLGLSYDHKVIGVQYAVTAVVLLVVGGTFALLFRIELAHSGMQFLNFIQFNSLIGLHGMVLIASMLLGGAAIGNYTIPLLIGARDMAFPRLNALAFWLAVPGALLVLMSMPLGGFETGWTGYPPLSVRGPMGIQMFFTGVWFVGWSSILGGLNLIATILRMRTKGMEMFKMPILAWAVLATSIITLTATQLIGLSFQLVLFERLLKMPFFEPAGGGNPLLFQHLFWFYSHPAVYVFVLPGFGVISELLPVFARKPLFGYKWVALSSMGIAVVGFLVWGHHMFAAGIEEYLRVPFMYSTLLVAVPTGVKVFSWTATLWMGKLRFPSPMLFSLGALVVFLTGGLTGPPLGIVANDLQLTDTYFVVGHFHATMFGGYIFPFFAALYYWFPKATGRRMDERLAKWHFWLMFPAFLVMSLGQMAVGLHGMRRRIADYDPALGLDFTQLLVSIAGFVIAISVLVFIINLVKSLRHGEVAVGNIWESRSPEWQVPSPAPMHNYPVPVYVVGDPYDYGLPGSRYVQLGGDPPTGSEPADGESPRLAPEMGD
jgi:cytochrome c oxidase subunit I